jgi:DNA-binding NtrC family response regulator
VDPDPAVLDTLYDVAASAGLHVLAEREFEAARQRLARTRPDILVVNVRLGPYNGLHLVYLARLRNPQVDAMVYGGADDLPLAMEAQQAGAVFELETRVGGCLSAYLESTLFAADRTALWSFDAGQRFARRARARS